MPGNDPEMQIGLTLADSSASRPPDPFRPGGPNVLLVVLDDCGFAQLGCYGSPIATPTIDRLAAEGLRYTNFHTTAFCSPTRACVLTGRNHHRVGMGGFPDLPLPFPGYTGVIPPEAASLPAVLRESGWVTWAVGKWHLTPRDHRGPAGPFHTWPTGQGFDRYYGFLGGEESQWTPDLVRDQSYVDPPRTPEQGYHLTEDMADEAIGMIRELRLHQPSRPFLLYWATAAPHAPHHVHDGWIKPYEGAFDDGWDVLRERTLARQIELGVVPGGTELSPRPGWVEAWDDLDASTKRLYARLQEVFAGFLTHTDAQLGRIIDCLDDLGELDNTIVMVMSDNGASGEGGPYGSTNYLTQINGGIESLDRLKDTVDTAGGHRGYSHYPWGWAHAGNTPLRRWKRYTLEGGVRDPLIVRWPAAVADPGGFRSQYCHAIDVLPTVLDLLDVEMPPSVRSVPQMSLDGRSMVPSIADAGSAEFRPTQYYECWGSRAIYHDGWKAVTNHVNQFSSYERDMIDGSVDFHADEWMLFDSDRDFAESTDLAGAHPERLAELQARWDAEAERNDVLPLQDSPVYLEHPHLIYMPFAGFRRTYELRSGERLNFQAGPLILGGLNIAAELDGVLGDSDGVIVEHGDWTAGWAWAALGDELVAFVLAPDRGLSRFAVPRPVGATELGLRIAEVDGGSTVEQFADGSSLGSTTIDATIPFISTANGTWTTAGYSTPFPVSDEYEPPLSMPHLRRIVIDTDTSSLPGLDDLFDDVVRHQ